MPEKTLVSSTSWSATGLPSGVTINSSTGAIEGTPANGTADPVTGSTTYTPAVTVTTPYGTSTKNISILIRKTFEIRAANGTSITRLRNLSEIQQYISDGTILDRYGVGSTLVIQVKNNRVENGQNYDCPMILGEYKEWEKEDGTKFMGLGLESQYTFPYSVQFDAAEPDNPDNDRKNYGNNRWKFSALRQLMNKSGTDWWESQHEYDAAPQQSIVAIPYTGLLDAFPQDFLDMTVPVKVVTRTHSLDGSVDDVTYDRFFPLSLSEMGITDNTGNQAVADTTEGTMWQHVQKLYGSSRLLSAATGSGGMSGLVKYSMHSPSSKNNYWTRSAYLGHSYYVWYVYSYGSLNYYYAYGAYGFAPACVLRGS